MNVKMKAGRPTDYTVQLARQICDVIAATSKGIKTLCKENENWPSHNSIYRWLSTHKEFSDLYARAKRQQVDVIVDEILDIADDSLNDSLIDEDGRPTIDHEHINRSRLKIDTRKWLAAKLCPRLYGSKDEHVNLNFPCDLTKGSALLPMSAEVLRALANKEITPEQAKTLLSSIKDHGANIVIGDLNERLARLENTANNHTIIEGESSA